MQPCFLNVIYNIIRCFFFFFFSYIKTSLDLLQPSPHGRILHEAFTYVSQEKFKGTVILTDKYVISILPVFYPNNYMLSAQPESYQQMYNRGAES